MRKRVIFGSLLAALAVGTAAADQNPAAIPTADELAPHEWNRVEPGGDTICSRGTEYSFFVRPADPKKLMIHFEGGGACWNGINCSDSPFNTFDEEVAPDEANLATEGIFDDQNEENPMRDFTTVGVMYCTADVHSGNQSVDYDGTVIEHKGSVNTEAVLKWVFENYPDPETVFVNGCSAGSYGSIFYAAQVAEHYSDARFVHMGDAGIGVLSDDFYQALERWGMFEVLGTLYPGLASLDRPSFSIDSVYEYASQAIPNGTFTEYTAIEDENQTFFYQLMGGDPADWAARAQVNLDRLASLPNFASYTAPGDVHCILPLKDFYEVESNGVRFRDWVADLVTGKPVQTVKPTE